jgi:predicted molibdopterin-dependent oxidoreductase YjgC
MKEVTITIDGLKIQAKEGMTVLRAALANGLYIPNLCDHPDLVPAGLCRVCVVKMDGWKIVIACKQPVKEGMVIDTEAPEVQQIRKSSVELLVANHSMTCLTCEADADCELQRVAHYVGITPEDMKRYRRSVRNLPVDTSNPFFKMDHNKCILCGICVRTCDELQNINAIDFAKRGVNSLISTFSNKPIADSSCESCGECVVRCPVGALSFKNKLRPTRQVRSICTYCGVGCGVLLGVRGSAIVGVEGDRDSPVSKGSLCVKGRFGYGFVHHPDRLTTPLIRKDGVLVEAGWDEALQLVASKFTELITKYGADTVGGFSSSRCTNEENYLFAKWVRTAVGSNNVDNCARV